MFTAAINLKAGFRRTAIAAIIIGSAALTGCTTTGVSSSNTPLGDKALRPQVTTHAMAIENAAAQARPAARQSVEDVDSIRAVDVINRSKANVSRSGEIYLMRGLANIFSRGIDKMANDLRAKGYDASNFSYKYWQPVAEDIVARSKRGEVSYPVVIIGHSLGGNESSKFANYLGSRGVEVSLVVAFDPVETGHVGKNIDRVVNYYLPKDNTDNTIHADAGFDGSIENIDVTSDNSITHTNVEKNARFQSASYKEIAKLTKAL
ncbi:MAG: hypothetical protein H6888_05955 [Nitratireductor sp.]|nr:hypothetical protein [Nitratireductor sp.]MCC0020603.1 hypothetical protein [Nitratireductor sp.]